jgi:hypothetical protein
MCSMCCIHLNIWMLYFIEEYINDVDIYIAFDINTIAVCNGSIKTRINTTEPTT